MGKKKFVKKEITPEMIQVFLDGHDPQERIVNLEYSYNDEFIYVFYRDENDVKEMAVEPFFPFVWAKRAACLKLFGGDRLLTRNEMIRAGIWCEELDTTDTDGNEVAEMQDGYTFRFYAVKPMSYKDFLAFFKRAGVPVYAPRKKEEPGKSFTEQPIAKKNSSLFLAVTPQEQYLISTGKRFFKGYDDYDQVLRMIFDLETTGLDTKKDRIEEFGISFNRPFMYGGKMIEFNRIFSTKGETEEEKNQSELANIILFFKVIKEFKPDVITGHNCETFDWNIIFGACERLGFDIDAYTKELFGDAPVRKETKESILKLGGEIETYYRTIVPKSIVTDSLHAVRRAQALDSNMLFSNLKYVTKYSKIVKHDRVYVPGDRISEILNDTEKHYAFNMEDGDWYIYDPSYVRELIKPDPLMTVEYFERKKADDAIISSMSGTTAETVELTAEEMYAKYLKEIDEKNEENRTKRGKDGNQFTLYTRNEILPGYELVGGDYIVKRYLLDDLWECDKVEHRYNIPNFLICKMLPVPFQRCCTMGTAGQWKAIMLAWSFENHLAIPPFGEKRRFTGGLSRLLKVGFVDRIAKFDFNSLYPAIILTWGITDPKDLMNAMLYFLEHVLTNREKYKGLKKKASKAADKVKEDVANGTAGPNAEEEYAKYKEEESANDKKQLPLKIFGNSFFGSYGAPNVFPWASVECAERTTCTGRQSLRLMIYWFNKIGYKPIVGDTDGFNFQLPEEGNFRYTDEHPYISTGMSRETEKGKAYTGFKADVAEFNDLFMGKAYFSDSERLKMGLGIDEVVDATINFSRKNYADYFPENPYPEDVKMVGNTIKSKKMPEYIAKFLEKGIRLLLRGKGQRFIDEYYNYIDKIYNYQIPLNQIATKGKIKKTIEEYKKDCQTLTKAGRPKSRQAWMELAIANGIDVNMGETLYYVNTGKSKSQADVKKVTHFYKEDGLFGDKADCRVALEKEWKAAPDGKATKITLNEWVKKAHPEVTIEEEIILNCQLIPREVIDSENDILCGEGEEYNVPKYVDMFNKRITPLLVCFNPEIRNKILIDNPEKRQYFTYEQCELCSGFPNKEGDQDTYEQLMTMEDKEIQFWLRHPEWKIPYLEECGMNWDDIVNDYRKRKQREKELGIEKVRTIFDEVINNMTSDMFEDFENGDLPAQLTSIINIDPKTGNFVSKDYPDIVIGTIYDVYDAMEAKAEDEEPFEEEA